MGFMPDQALHQLPPGLRNELLSEFHKISRNFRESRWEAEELDGGRLCEIVYTILHGYLSGGTYASTASKPDQFKVKCEQLANLGSRDDFPKSARVTVPLVLVPLYDLRNNRGVGHVGGDVDANEMDATYVLHATQWIMAELVRLFHDLTTASAAKVVNSLVQRTVPLLWEVDGVTRVLDSSMTLGDKTLVRLYAAAGPTPVAEVARDLEQGKLSNYIRVLDKLHGQKMIEYNRLAKVATISPLGVDHVERRVLRS